MQDLVSVIIPVYNVEQYLDRCIASVVNQSYKALEIILVDDGSPDKCPAICDAWAEKDSRIRVIHKANGGVSDARNIGVSAASGRYIVFIDSDDYVDEHIIKAFVECCDHKETIVACDFDVVSENKPNNRIPEEVFRTSKKIAGLRDFYRERNGLFACGILFRKDLIVSPYEIKFDTQLKNLEDTVWMIQLLTRVKEAVFIHFPYYHYYIRQNSATSNCIDYSWQARSWNKALNSIKNSFVSLRLKDKFKSKNLLYMIEAQSLCKRNFYAECFSGDIKYEQMKAIAKYPKAEYWLYKNAFFIRDSLIKRKKRLRL